MKDKFKIFLSLFLFSDWLKSNHLTYGIKRGFLDIFSRHICCVVIETIRMTKYAKSFGAKKCSKNNFEVAEMTLDPWNKQVVNTTSGGFPVNRKIHIGWSIDLVYAPHRFSCAVSERFAVGRWNFQSFSIYVLGIWKCNFHSPETQLVAKATQLLRGVCCSFSENHKKPPISTWYHPLIHNIASDFESAFKI